GHEGAPYFRCVNTHATLDHVRNPNPAEVVYTVDPALFEVNPARDVDLRYDSAYWVSGITVREPAPGTVAATSRALPHHRLEAVRTHEVRGNTVDGQDLCGPNPNFPPGWSPVHPDGETWRERSLRLVEQEPLPQSNQLEVSLTNVAAVVFDLDRAGLGGAPGTVLVDTDGPATLRFAGLARKAPVAVDGQVVTRADRHGGATVSVGSGQHTINVG
ncbi:MAG TPA: hypothetical protein VF183_14525, partial [Acidimicrobiales bacterium]